MKVFPRTCIIFIISIIGLFACQSETSEEERNSKVKVQNLETFARLYGYARWFHPSDEAQEIDWDKFAVLGVQKVENIKSPAALRDTLYKLFSPIVQGIEKLLNLMEEMNIEDTTPNVHLKTSSNVQRRTLSNVHLITLQMYSFNQVAFWL